MQDLIGSAIGEERPGGTGLRTSQTERSSHLLSSKAQQPATGSSGTKRAGSSGNMPAQVAVAGNPETHSNAGHDLIAADNRSDQVFATFAKGLCQCPGGRNDYRTDMCF